MKPMENKKPGFKLQKKSVPDPLRDPHSDFIEKGIRDARDLKYFEVGDVYQ